MNITSEKTRTISECPVCGSQNSNVLVAYSPEDPLRHLSIAASNKAYGFLKAQIHSSWNGDVCYFLECSNCKLNFASPFTAGTNELYSSFYSSADSYGSINWEHRMAEEILKSQGPDDSKYFLEIGAGDGAFIKQVGEKYFRKENIVCTESSDYAVSALNQYSITCLKGAAKLKTDQYKTKFDVIAMFQVLEHLDQIDDLFHTLNYISKKGADLFIAVPNYSIRKFYEENGIFLDVPPVHITRWNQNSFRILGERYGWKVESYHVEKVSFFAAAYNFVWNKTLNKRVGKIKRKMIRKPLIALLLPPMFLLNFFKIIRIRTDSNGISQLVHFKKN